MTTETSRITAPTDCGVDDEAAESVLERLEAWTVTEASASPVIGATPA